MHGWSTPGADPSNYTQEMQEIGEMTSHVKESMEALLRDLDFVHAYVYFLGHREEFFFANTPEHIAAFLGSHPDAEQMTLTDPMDNLILDTIENFIDRCPDKVLLEQVKKTLIPIQMGEAKPVDIFCPTLDEVERYYVQKEADEKMGGITLE